MALRAKSLFLYGLEVRDDNQNLPFKAASLGPELNAVIPAGYYSLTDLIAAVSAAMQVADPAHIYTVTVDRTAMGGTENRITISTNGSFLSLLFASGSTAASSIRDLIAFGIFDYTGNTMYTNGATSGVALVTEWYAKNYSTPQLHVQNFGTVNVSASGDKEAITWSLQYFIDGEWENEPQPKAFSDWPPLINWMIQQKPFDFTPEVSAPTTVYNVTLEKTGADGKGLAFLMKEQVPMKPFFYTTGQITMRIKGALP